jgi:hypothetical protein
MNALAAAALAAGELICEFSDGYRKSFLAQMVGDPPRTEVVIVYEALQADSAEVLSTRKPGRRPVVVRPGRENVYFIEGEGPSVRVTALTGCTRYSVKDAAQICTRFSARHAWHFDTSARVDPDAAFAHEPPGAASGWCEPWEVD